MPTPTGHPHVIVVGGGFGGLSAARALARKPVRVLVNPDLTIPGHPEVFVVGDLAAFATGTDAGRRQTYLPGVAQVAMQQAAHAAGNILRATAGASSREFHYRNYGNMATIGRAAAVADFGWFRLTGQAAWLAWLFVHIMQLTGFRNCLVVLVQWGYAYVTYQRNVRLITGPPDGDEAGR